MRTTLDLDESLLKEALEVTEAKTKKSVIELALRELITKVKIKNFINSFGSIPDFPVTTETVRQWRDQNDSIVEAGSVNDPSLS